MRNPGGHATVVGPTHTDDGLPAGPKGLAENGECDTYSCGHCQYVVHVEPFCDPSSVGGLCKQCMRLICPTCVDKLTCTPWEKKFEEMENRDHWRRTIGEY